MSDSLDIEQIEKEIREEIVKSYSSDEILSFEPAYSDEIVPEVDCSRNYDLSYFEDMLDACKRLSTVHYYKPIVGNPLYVFVKRVLRKLNVFLLKPIVEEQSSFNYAVTELCAQLSLRLDEQSRMIEDCHSESHARRSVECE